MVGGGGRGSLWALHELFYANSLIGFDVFACMIITAYGYLSECELYSMWSDNVEVGGGGNDESCWDVVFHSKLLPVTMQ